MKWREIKKHIFITYVWKNIDSFSDQNSVVKQIEHCLSVHRNNIIIYILYLFAFGYASISDVQSSHLVSLTHRGDSDVAKRNRGLGTLKTQVSNLYWMLVSVKWGLSHHQNLKLYEGMELVGSQASNFFRSFLRAKGKLNCPYNWKLSGPAKI